MIRTSAHATKTTRNAGMRSQPILKCARCQDTRWVCEEHPDKPMGYDGCKGAGDPCLGSLKQELAMLKAEVAVARRHAGQGLRAQAPAARARRFIIPPRIDLRFG